MAKKMLNLVAVLYLTLTRVVFESNVIDLQPLPLDLTLTRVVFELM